MRNAIAQSGKRMAIAAGIILVASAGCFCPWRLDAQAAFATNLTASAILNRLKTQQGEELHDFLLSLRGVAGTLRLTDQEIDAIITQLRTIQQSDPYQKELEAFKDPARRKMTVFPNREATPECIFHFQFQKIVNSLRSLPLDQRVAKIIEGIEHPPETLQYESVGSFAGELIRAGKDAVPFIVQHKPRQSYHRRAIVRALAAIGDPRGIDYIIDVLNTRDESFKFERPIAAEALGKFNEKRVVLALVEALKDDTYQDIDRHLPQVDYAGHKPHLGRYYSVQHAAAKSLTQLSGKDWGLFYGEDHGTWSAWLQSKNPDAFSPSTVVRTDAEAARLIGYMFHRRMSARPNPWQPQNVLESPEGVRCLSRDLKQLGPRVVPLVVNEYHARVTETPLWHDELRTWTKGLLQGLDWNEAKDAAETAIN